MLREVQSKYKNHIRCHHRNKHKYYKIKATGVVALSAYEKSPSVRFSVIRVSVNILLKHTLFVKNKYFLLLQHKIRKQTQSQSGRQHCKTKEPQVRTGALSKWGRRDVLKETFQTFCKETHPNESSVFNLCFFFLCFLYCAKQKFKTSH